MFTDVDLTKLESAAAEYVINNDRMMYQPYFACAERFISDNENNCMLGGATGLDLLLKNPLNVNSFSWDIYFESKEPYNYAKRFADAISESGTKAKLNYYIMLKTEIKNIEFVIYIDTRLMFRLISLREYRGVSLMKLMNIPTVKSYHESVDIKVLPEDAQIIDLLQKLYNPGECDEWPKLIEHEQFLYEKYKNRNGGHEKNKYKHSNLNTTEQLLQYIRESKSILIGSYAIDALRIDTQYHSRIQFITSKSINDVVREISRLLEIPCKPVQFNVNLATDFQLTKHTIYIETKQGSQIPICDVFNSTEYELIPIWDEHNISYNDIMIGNPYVIMRFLYIDIWLFKMISGISGASMDSKIRELWVCIHELRNYINKAFNLNPSSVFQLDNYIGDYTNPVVAKKKMIKDIGYHAKPYYPQFSHLEKN